VNEYSDVVNEMADEGRVKAEEVIEEGDEGYVSFDDELPEHLIQEGP